MAWPLGPPSLAKEDIAVSTTDGEAPINRPLDVDDIGLYAWSQSKSDMFVDAENKVINFDFFQRYFDQVSLPVDLAKACLGDLFGSRARQIKSREFVKFIRLSTLRQYKRLPEYHEVRRDLVDYSKIKDFSLQGRLSWWGGEDIFSVSPCVFVSHRWLSIDHPDPHGSQLETILSRLDRMLKRDGQGPSQLQSQRRTAAEEVYLWIDFCCLPQSRGRNPLSHRSLEQFQIGLARLPEIVKSCDLMILYSPDYMTRAWCYSELFVWLCKLAEVGYTNNDNPSKLFQSVQTRHSFSKDTTQSNRHIFDDSVTANLAFRGYEGSTEELLRVYGPIREYCHDMADAAQYNIAGMSGNFDAEYLPVMVNFLCKSWLILQRMGCSTRDDIEICLRVIIDGLKYAYYGTGN
jgi:hypothetical protein